LKLPPQKSGKLSAQALAEWIELLRKMGANTLEEVQNLRFPGTNDWGNTRSLLTTESQQQQPYKETPIHEDENLREKIQGLCRKFGIPPMLRPKVWFEMTGAKDKMQANSEFYQQLCTKYSEFIGPSITSSVIPQLAPAAGKEPENVVLDPDLHQIELDLPRTFPDHPLFMLQSSKGRDALRRILVSFSFLSQ